MLSLVSQIGNTLLLNLLQFIIGCILAIFLYKFYRSKKNSANIKYNPYLIMVLSSLFGIVLPLDTYGVIPIFVVAISIGINLYFILPMFISNSLFNLLIPLTNNNFIWKSNISLICLALIIGIFIGIILNRINVDEKLIFRHEIIYEISLENFKLKDLKKVIGIALNIIGPYLILGAISNTIFQRQLFDILLNFFYSSPLGSITTSFMMGHNVTNPFFMISLSIFNMFTDLVKFSALLLIFRWRGIVGYFIYYSIWALLMASSMFFF